MKAIMQAIGFLPLCITMGADANSWAVRLTSGGSRAADELASKYGFINLGPVRLAKSNYAGLVIVVLQIDDDPTIPENEQVYEFTRKSNSRSNLPKDVVDILTSDLLSEPKVGTDNHIKYQTKCNNDTSSKHVFNF